MLTLGKSSCCAGAPSHAARDGIVSLKPRPKTGLVTICILGGKNVGKSTLFNALCGLSLIADPNTPKSVEITVDKDIRHPITDARILLSFRDTVGDEGETENMQAYARRANVLVYMYSLDDEATFDRIERDISYWSSNTKSRVVVFANKRDLIPGEIDLGVSRRRLAAAIGRTPPLIDAIVATSFLEKSWVRLAEQQIVYSVEEFLKRL